MAEYSKYLGESIYRNRKRQRMTQAELAAKVGTSQANICKLEHAEMNPSFALAQRVANGLGKRLALSLE